MKNTAQTFKYTAIGLGGAIAALVVWSFIEPYTLNTETETETETAIIPNLPSAWEGQKAVK